MTKRWTATKSNIQPKRLAAKQRRARMKRITESYEAAKEAGWLTDPKAGKKGTLR